MVPGALEQAVTKEHDPYYIHDVLSRVKTAILVLFKAELKQDHGKCDTLTLFTFQCLSQSAYTTSFPDLKELRNKTFSPKELKRFIVVDWISHCTVL